MRTVTYGAACSLDGFITGPDGAIDWLHFSKDVGQVMKDYWSRVDTVLLGRRTWEAALAQSGGKGESAPGTRSYVFSRTLPKVEAEGVQLVSEDAGGFVRKLKAEPGRDICVLGGGDLARSLFAAGLIDEVSLNVHPVLLGSGTPFFQDAGRRIRLDLKENRTIDGGCILATYAVHPD